MQRALAATEEEFAVRLGLSGFDDLAAVLLVELGHDDFSIYANPRDSHAGRSIIKPYSAIRVKRQCQLSIWPRAHTERDHGMCGMSDPQRWRMLLWYVWAQRITIPRPTLVEIRMEPYPPTHFLLSHEVHTYLFGFC